MSVRHAVDRGLEIIEQIEILELELKGLQLQLEAAGLAGEQVELADPDREGRQFLAKGTEAIVPVVFTADLLVKSFALDSAVEDRINTSLGGHQRLRSHFFTRYVIFKTSIDSGKEFRRQAGEVLGEKAPAFVSACLQRDKHGIPKSQVKIEWTRAGRVGVPPAGEAVSGSRTSPKEVA